MAWPALVAVAKTVPWLALVKQAPAILEAANRLRSKSNSKADISRDRKPLEPEIDEIQKILAHLQNQDLETAEVIRQLAEQNRDMATSIQTLAGKIRALGYGLLVTVFIALAAVVKVFL
jgi:septal ring factor EnvC (AmiA/AmiB activator)